MSIEHGLDQTSYQSADGHHQSNHSRQTPTFEPLTQDGFLNDDHRATADTVQDASDDHHRQVGRRRREGHEDVADCDQDGGDDGPWNGTKDIDKDTSQQGQDGIHDGHTGLYRTIL